MSNNEKAARRRLPVTVRVALGAAFVWCLLLLLAAFTLPVYGTSSASSSGGATTTGTQTLIEANGMSALVVLVVPLLLVVAVAQLLIAGGDRARNIAWITTGALAALTGLGFMSIGMFLMPAVVALVVACATAGRAARFPVPA